MSGEMIRSAELPAALIAFEWSLTAVNPVMSTQLVDAVELLFAVSIWALESYKITKLEIAFN